MKRRSFVENGNGFVQERPHEFQQLKFDFDFYQTRENLLMNTDFMLMDQKPQLVETINEDGELEIHIDMFRFASVSFEDVREIRNEVDEIFTP